MDNFRYCGRLKVLDIPNSNIKKVKIVNLGNLTMNEWYDVQTDKPKYMLNASLWDEQGPIGTIWLDGKLIRNEGNGFGFGVNTAGDWGFSNPWDVTWNDYITGYPSLIYKGQKTDLKVDNYVQNTKTKRSVVACAGSYLYFITADSLTIEELKEELYNFGAFHAINLDGGGSSRLLVDGEAVNRPTDDRECKLAIAVWTKDQHWAEPYYNELINKRIKIEDKRFDDSLTRGEAFNLLSQMMNLNK